MSAATMSTGLEPLKRDLELVAMIRMSTVPEVVASIKKDMVADGADVNNEAVSTFFAQLDEVARLHTC